LLTPNLAGGPLTHDWFSDLSIMPEHSTRAGAKWLQAEHHQMVGAALAVARRRANLTQVELARRLGKPQSVMSAYEAGKRRVDVVELLLIVRSLGADPVDIFADIAKSLPSLGSPSDRPPAVPAERWFYG
jgi:DNA-binding transcriptional regulator YiaG